MKAIFNESLLKRFNALMLPFAVIWSLSTAGGMLLKNSTTEGFSYRFEPFFEIFHFSEKFAILEHFDGAIHTKMVTTTKLVAAPHRVKAIYRSNVGSFISINDTKETQIVSLGGMYKKTFRLTGLTDSTATFNGLGKTYRLRLGYDDPLSRKEVVTTSVADPSQKSKLTNEWRTIKYQTLISQMDMQNIQKNINVSEVTNGNKRSGFKVNSVTPGSIFDELGIMNEDVLLSINSKKLESYSDALIMYSRVPHLKSIRITLNRNNLQKDIIYEVIR